MRNKVVILAGVLAPIIYAATVVLGGLLRPGYSHISQAVSDLIASQAPNKALLDPLFGVYNLFMIAFAIGLYQRVRSEGQRGGGAGTVGALILLAQGIFGLVTLFFPEDAGGVGAPISSMGTMHIVLASLSSLTTMLGMLLMGFWFRKVPRLRAYGLYSFISVAAVFVSGGLAALGIATQGPVAGLMERITIGGFLLWVFVVALKMYRLEAVGAAPTV